MNGVIFIATGAEYADAAKQAANSIRQNAPNLAIDLFTNIDFGTDHPFDEIHAVSNPHRRSKVDYLPLTRFDRTLYLDSDVRVVADISEMFGVLNRFDLAIAHAHARNRPSTRDVWNKQIPDAFPQLNGGVILFRRTAAVIGLLEQWREAFHAAGFSKDQVTLRELLWDSDLRIHILPPEYNLRYPKYLSVWAEGEAAPRIQHFRDYNPPSDQPKKKLKLNRLLPRRMRKLVAAE